jgi:hypothetical protein
MQLGEAKDWVYLDRVLAGRLGAEGAQGVEGELGPAAVHAHGGEAVFRRLPTQLFHLYLPRLLLQQRVVDHCRKSRILINNVSVKLL